MSLMTTQTTRFGNPIFIFQRYLFTLSSLLWKITQDGISRDTHSVSGREWTCLDLLTLFLWYIIISPVHSLISEITSVVANLHMLL